ncbi:MAG: hypothetical protein LBQ15_03005 [Clostridium sp.]|jgi:ABC-2 type transport system permease protein|nr:hypothetical protein [Clostridium sp.]
MKTIRNILSIYLYGVTRVNDFRYERNPTKKLRTALLAVVSVAAGLFLFAAWFLYTVRLGKDIPSSELFNILLAPMITLAGHICLFSAVLRGAGILFLDDDLEQLLCSPIRITDIVIGKTLIVYLFNFALSLFLMLPSFIVYGISLSQPFLYYVYAFFTILLVPVLSVIIGICVGIIIGVLVKELGTPKNHILTTLILAFVIIMLIGSFFIKSADADLLLKKVLQILSSLYMFYSYTSFYLKGLSHWSGALYFLLYLAGLTAISAVYVAGMGFYYRKIYAAIRRVKRKGALISDRSFQVSVPMKALYKRELKRYFSSTMYVVNTMAGVIFSFVLTLILLFKGDYLYSSFNSIHYFTNMPDKFHGLIIIALTTLVCLTNTAACSISLEGKTFFMLKGYPVSPFDIFQSKIAVNLTLTIPAILINAFILVFVLKLKAIEMLLIFLFPISFAVLTAMYGLTINLLLPRFDWTNEVTIVKHSMSSIIGIFGGISFVVIPSFLVLKYSKGDILFPLFLVFILAMALDCIFVFLLKRHGVKRFLRL